MNCSQAEPLLSAYVDGELAAAEKQLIADHLADCPGCAQAVHDLRALQATLGSETVYYQAPARLHSKVKAALAGRVVRSAFNEPLTVHSFVMVLVVLAALSGAVGVGWWWYNQPGPSLAELSVRSHAKAMASQRETDIASADPRNVAAWLQNKIGRAVVINDLSAQNYSLKGARLDRTALGTVPVVVYARDAHVFSVYHWPPQCGGMQAFRHIGKGCQVHMWHDGQGLCCAVSDLSARDLEEFAGLIRGKTSTQK